MNINYYPINEGQARRAHENRSFSDYKPGSATAAYRHEVDEAAAKVDAAKKRVEPEYYPKMDALFDKFCRQLAEYYNKDNEIGCRCPSIMIAGASNFPVRKKEKQVDAWDRNYQFYDETMKLIDKICSIGHGGISSDDPAAIAKLEKKLARLEADQEKMKSVNAYYRKHKMLDGCPDLSAETIERTRSDAEKGFPLEGKPFPTWALSNNSANIRRVKQRIEELRKAAENPAPDGWGFDGGKVEMNKDMNRVQIIFDDKPDADIRAMLKSYGFRWAPSVGAWQRQLNQNGIYAAKQVTKQITENL